MFRNPEGQMELMVPREFQPRILHPGFAAEVRYGTEPSPADIAGIRKELHDQAATAVATWLSEQRFIPKFLLSALAFGVMYFFMALVVRDPIPFVDEFVVAVASAVACFVLLSRRDRTSLLAAEMNGEVRSRVDAVRFVPDPALEALEDFFAGMSRRPDDNLDRLLQELSALLDGFEPLVAGQLRDWARGGLTISLPSARQVRRLLDNGISVRTWLEWCRGKAVSPWLGLVALHGNPQRPFQSPD